MINTKTVFVLGAGASIPYGFPSGAELRRMLCAPITRCSRKGDVNWIDSIAKLGIREADSRCFAEAFLKSGITSIDSFLSRRHEFEKIGKAAIAAIICALEEPQALHKTDNDDDWYSHLWNALAAGVHDCGSLASNQVRFVTFNYDRSLEYFLLQSCQETFGVNDDTAVRALKPLRIIHVYGALGKLDQNRTLETRPYETRVGSTELSVAAKGIKIIPESRSDAPEFNEARDLFGWAEQVCFLGFGFDPLNVSRLNLESVFASRRSNGVPPRIIASTYDKTLAENAAVQRSIPSSDSWWTMFPHKNLMTIRESGVLL